MSWDSYVSTLMQPDEHGKILITDGAIVGCEEGAESVWAGTPKLKGITAAEIKALMLSDKSKMFSTGLTIAGIRCTLIRDNLADLRTMDIKTKPTPPETITFNITVAKSNKALVIAMGGEGVHGGVPSDRAYKMVEYLLSKGY